MELLQLLKSIELYLNIEKPSFVKRAIPILLFDDLPSQYTEEDPILQGLMKIYIETRHQCFCVDIFAWHESFTDEESREKAKKAIISEIKEYLPSDLEDGAFDIWDDIDFEKETWKNKEK